MKIRSEGAKLFQRADR